MQTRFLDTDGGRLAYDDTRDDGHDGPLVLLVPGMLDTRQTFRHLSPLLTAAGYRVVSFDPRGYGETSPVWDDFSQAAQSTDISALVSHLDSGPALVVAHSYAASSICRTAGLHPELIAGFVVEDGFVRDVPAGRLKTFLVNTGAHAIAARPGLWGTYLKLAYPTAPPADFEEYLDGLTTMLREPERKAANRHHLLGAHADPTGSWAADVKCPTLVVMGAKDPDYNVASEAKWQSEALGGAEIAMIEGGGHYPHAEFPRETAEVVLSFFEQVLVR